MCAPAVRERDGGVAGAAEVRDWVMNPQARLAPQHLRCCGKAPNATFKSPASFPDRPLFQPFMHRPCEGTARTTRACWCPGV